MRKYLLVGSAALLALCGIAYAQMPTTPPLFPPSGTATAPAYGFANDHSTGFYSSAVGEIDITSGGVKVGSLTTGSGCLAAVGTANTLTACGSAANSPETITATGSDTNIPIILTPKGSAGIHLGGTTAANASLRVPTVSSAVNQVQVSGAATGGVANIIPGGSSVDTNAPIALSGVGTGSTLLGGTTTTLAGLQVGAVASQVNDVVLTPAATGTAPLLAAGGAGADANSNFALGGNGTGIVLLGPTACSATGTSPQTCNGQRGGVVSGTLTTAASTASTYTINNSSVSATSIVMCQLEAYSGTYTTNGWPVILDCKPGSTSITVDFANLNGSNALNGTLKIAFLVVN